MSCGVPPLPLGVAIPPPGLGVPPLLGVVAVSTVKKVAPELVVYSENAQFYIKGELVVLPCHDPFKLAPQMRGLSTRSSCWAEGLACYSCVYVGASHDSHTCVALCIASHQKLGC